jgi:hypothetical protein
VTRKLSVSLWQPRRFNRQEYVIEIFKFFLNVTLVLMKLYFDSEAGRNGVLKCMQSMVGKT